MYVNMNNHFGGRVSRIREGFTEDVAFAQDHKGQKGCMYMERWGKNSPDKEESKKKTPKTRKDRACSGSDESTDVQLGDERRGLG